MHFKHTPAGGISFQVSNFCTFAIVFLVAYLNGGVERLVEHLSKVLPDLTTCLAVVGETVVKVPSVIAWLFGGFIR